MPNKKLSPELLRRAAVIGSTTAAAVFLGPAAAGAVKLAGTSARGPIPAFFPRRRQRERAGLGSLGYDVDALIASGAIPASVVAPTPAPVVKAPTVKAPTTATTKPTVTPQPIVMTREQGLVLWKQNEGRLAMMEPKLYQAMLSAIYGGSTAPGDIFKDAFDKLSTVLPIGMTRGLSTDPRKNDMLALFNSWRALIDSIRSKGFVATRNLDPGYFDRILNSEDAGIDLAEADKLPLVERAAALEKLAYTPPVSTGGGINKTLVKIGEATKPITEKLDVIVPVFMVVMTAGAAAGFIGAPYGTAAAAAGAGGAGAATTAATTTAATTTTASTTAATTAAKSALVSAKSLTAAGGAAASVASAAAPSASTVVAATKELIPKVVQAVNTARTVAAVANGEAPPPPINIGSGSFADYAGAIAEQYMARELGQQQATLTQLEQAQLDAEIRALQQRAGGALVGVPQTSYYPMPSLSPEVQAQQSDAATDDMLKILALIGLPVLAVVLNQG